MNLTEALMLLWFANEGGCLGAATFGIANHLEPEDYRFLRLLAGHAQAVSGWANSGSVEERRRDLEAAMEFA